METDYQKLFNTLSPTTPSETLLPSIVARIHAEKRKVAFKRFVIFATASVASLGGLVTAVVLLVRSFVQSGSYHYVSLLFSDGISLFSYWKEIGLFVAESLPALGLAFLFGAGLVFVWSLTKVVRQAEVAFAVA